MNTLSNVTLPGMPSGVTQPKYDRSRLTPGIVHIGVGNFHRAHQAWYLHRLMQEGRALDWAIIGAGVRPTDGAMRDRLLRQDCLSTLIELDPKGKSAEIVGSMIDFLPVEDGNASLIAAMAKPKIRIVSTTVTEGGYYIDGTTGKFDAAHADIIHDAAHPETPRTAFGAIVAALHLRRVAGNAEYHALIARRFSNPEIKDTTRRVAFDGSSRHKGFVLPIIADAIAKGIPVDGLALVEALWARMCTGVRDDGRPIAPNDPFWDKLVQVATEAKREPLKWISQEHIYGGLAANVEFSSAFQKWLRMLYTVGCRATLKAYAGGARASKL